MLKVEAPLGANEILLHACCAPCSGAVLECLRDSGIRPVVFFSNSNIWPREEYDLRLAELRRYASVMGVDLVEDEYDHDAWREAVRGLENEPERGRRCAACFRFRLARAARYAASRGLPVLATTLASSRWKDLDQVNEAGESVCTAVAAPFHGSQPPETSRCARPHRSLRSRSPLLRCRGRHGFRRLLPSPLRLRLPIPLRPLRCRRWSSGRRTGGRAGCSRGGTRSCVSRGSTTRTGAAVNFRNVKPFNIYQLC